MFCYFVQEVLIIAKLLIIIRKVLIFCVVRVNGFYILSACDIDLVNLS
jgi:hypothetical protein